MLQRRGGVKLHLDYWAGREGGREANLLLLVLLVKEEPQLIGLTRVKRVTLVNVFMELDKVLGQVVEVDHLPPAQCQALFHWAPVHLFWLGWLAALATL